MSGDAVARKHLRELEEAFKRGELGGVMPSRAYCTCVRWLNDEPRPAYNCKRCAGSGIVAR